MLKAMDRATPTVHREVALEALSYSSAAVRIPTAQELEYLLKRARSRNEQEAVTGVLLYNGGCFHQYLEGPSAGIERVYAAICRDRLHHRIFEMLREPIETREFEGWAMGYQCTNRIDGTFKEVALTSLLADESDRLSGGRLLLNAFWNRGMGTHYQASIEYRQPAI
jgi:hypothetical protein